jgi:hypothetical protein
MILYGLSNSVRNSLLAMSGIPVAAQRECGRFS